MTDARHLLVCPDRDAAEELAGELTARFDLPEEPRPVREALAGDDDAEDAQWLVVLEDGQVGGDGTARFDPDELDALAAAYDGWHERG